ncbi:MAG: sigma-70 family RNA polymerase sigma factor [Gemmatimonadetes bacterium]|nr:sigma-70 family RNA polymerase sigma factor [Gemmatimonadota bacterium]MYD24908.1 sigma-70 family RNA polymerase sigma factor [Gemmatimonadota bacterium]
MKLTTKIQVRDDESLDLYLKEIGDTELLTPEDEEELARRIRDGDEKALETMIHANLRFVVVVAKQYQNQGLALSDLISEGNIGLMKAARRFDEKKGFKFISYAVWWIRQAILHALAEQARLIRLPVNKIEELRRIERTIKKREAEMAQAGDASGDGGDEGEERSYGKGRHPALPEWASTPLSLDAPVGDQDAYTLMDRLRDQDSKMPDDALQEELLRTEVRRAVSNLTDRESEVLNLYFGLNSDRAYTLEEIGVRFGLTRERIRQIKQKAINKLRHTRHGSRLAAYAD